LMRTLETGVRGNPDFPLTPVTPQPASGR